MSIATVSRVINNAGCVSEDTKRRVISVMEECGYVPNAFARGLGLNTMKTVGVLCASAADAFLARGVTYIEQALRRNGYDCLLCCTEYDQKTREQGVELLLSKHVDSLIFVGSHFVDAQGVSNEYIIRAAKRVPVMLVNAAVDGENIYSVLCDDYRATMDATEALLSGGRKNVLFLYNGHTYSAQRKLRGYTGAYEKRGITPKGELIIDMTGRSVDITDVKRELMQRSDEGLKFDAVMTSEDWLAVGALKYARDRGLCVPKDLAVIGYNNSQICLCAEPELTSVDNRLEAICNQCVETLLCVLAGKEAPQRTLYKAELVLRGTT